jgi:hypothetical protein
MQYITYIHMYINKWITATGTFIPYMSFTIVFDFKRYILLWRGWRYLIIYIYTWVCIYIHLYLIMYWAKFGFKLIIKRCVYICMHVYMDICIYMYTYINIILMHAIYTASIIVALRSVTIKYFKTITK